ncbi:uncharacterized protein UTRI_10107 [Ustilago trichophora]|uniref:Uncharacterized protein n=1 Tax=Ustilago trichophora TaxID=86804 RepID=A0A5C3E5V6_9BASI|nr:uncharacterized protein UTRI_10107 [Ustilago trichophora]
MPVNCTVRMSHSFSLLLYTFIQLQAHGSPGPLFPKSILNPRQDDGRLDWQSRLRDSLGQVEREKEGNYWLQAGLSHPGLHERTHSPTKVRMQRAAPTLKYTCGWQVCKCSLSTGQLVPAYAQIQMHQFRATPVTASQRPLFSIRVLQDAEDSLIARLAPSFLQLLACTSYHWFTGSDCQLSTAAMEVGLID